jgi:peptidase C13-like protein
MKLRRLFFVVLLASAFVAAVAANAGQLRAALNVGAAPATKNGNDATDDADDHPIVWPSDAGSPEQILYSQPDRMRAALAHLAPRTPGKANLFLISFAGDGEEDVFRNEVEYVDKLFSERFAAKGHVLALVNNPATLTEHPIASLSNLELAVDGLAKKMNVEQDVLMVFITTHGSRNHELYVSLDPLPLDQIVPEDLEDLFSDSPIKHRVFVISACYSGAFVDALKNPDAMVITASREDRASFGCGAQSAITDFGRAFFVDGLNHTASFADAFIEASTEVDGWETRDHQPHSFPQIASGAPIEGALKRWRDGLKLGPAVPFLMPAEPHRHAPPRDGEQSTVATR